MYVSSLSWRTPPPTPYLADPPSWLAPPWLADPPPCDGWLGRSAFALTKRTCFEMNNASKRKNISQTENHRKLLFIYMCCCVEHGGAMLPGSCQRCPVRCGFISAICAELVSSDLACSRLTAVAAQSRTLTAHKRIQGPRSPLPLRFCFSKS